MQKLLEDLEAGLIERNNKCYSYIVYSPDFENANYYQTITSLLNSYQIYGQFREQAAYVIGQTFHSQLMRSH